MKEKKNNLHQCPPQYKLHSHSLMKPFSHLSYMNKIKTYIKKKTNSKLQTKEQHSLHSPLSHSLWPKNLQVFIANHGRGERLKIGGANTPHISTEMPRKHGQGRIFAAWVWPVGHTLGVQLPVYVFFPFIQ